MRTADDQSCRVVEVKHVQKRSFVFNIEVAGSHTFHVTRRGVLVHNAGINWAAYQDYALRQLGFVPQPQKSISTYLPDDRVPDYFDPATGEAAEITKLDFNQTFEDPEAFERLEHKRIQLAKDEKALQEGRIKKLDIVTADDLPTTGRGSRYTDEVRRLENKFPGQVKHSVIPAPRCP